MALGRVPSRRIGALDRGDWEFIQGFADREPVWGARHDTARAVFEARSNQHDGRAVPLAARCLRDASVALPTSRPPSSRSLAGHPLGALPGTWPWGPWTLFHEAVFAPQAFYNPSIPVKFVSEDGLSFWIFTAGDFATQAHYALHAVPVSLEVEE